MYTVVSSSLMFFDVLYCSFFNPKLKFQWYWQSSVFALFWLATFRSIALISYVKCLFIVFSLCTARALSLILHWTTCQYLSSPSCSFCSLSFLRKRAEVNCLVFIINSIQLMLALLRPLLRPDHLEIIHAKLNRGSGNLVLLNWETEEERDRGRERERKTEGERDRGRERLRLQCFGCVDFTFGCYRILLVRCASHIPVVYIYCRSEEIVRI